MEGKVKFFNRVKGFGFITGDDGKDYFVHYTSLADKTFIREGDVVSFNGTEGDRGLKAENVNLVKKASELGGSTEGSQESEGQASAKAGGEDEDGGNEDNNTEEEAEQQETY